MGEPNNDPYNDLYFPEALEFMPDAIYVWIYSYDDSDYHLFSTTVQPSDEYQYKHANRINGTWYLCQLDFHYDKLQTLKIEYSEQYGSSLWTKYRYLNGGLNTFEDTDPTGKDLKSHFLPYPETYNIVRPDPRPNAKKEEFPIDDQYSQTRIVYPPDNSNLMWKYLIQS